MQIEGDWGFRLRNAPRRGLARIRRTSGFFMSAVVNFSSTLNEPAGVVSLASQGWGVVNPWSLSAQDRWASFIHKKFRIQSEKPTCVSCLTLGFAFEMSEANDLCERGCAIRKYFNTFGERATEAFLVPKPSKTIPFSSRG